MSNGRTILAAALREQLTGWQVVSDARQLDSVRNPGAAVVWTQMRKRMELNGFEMLTDEVVVWILTAATKPEDIESSLDVLLLEALEVLEGLPEFSWDQAERGVLSEKFDGWRLSVACAYKIGK